MAHANERLLLAQAGDHLLGPQRARVELGPLFHVQRWRLLLLVVVVVGAGAREDARGAPGQEEHAFVAQRRVHAAKGFVEDDEVRGLDEGAEEEREALGGEGEVAEPERFRPVGRGVHVEHLVGVLEEPSAPRVERVRGSGFDGNGGRCPGGFEVGFEPSKRHVHAHVSLVGELGRGEKSVRPGGLEASAQGKVFREEIMDFGARMTDAGLEVEDGDPRLPWAREARFGEEFDGEGIGLGVIGADERKKGRFAGAVGAEDAPAGIAADGPVKTMGGMAI